MIDRKFESVNWEEFKLLCSALDLKIGNCFYCGDKITSKNYGLWCDPNRFVCSSPLCVSEGLEGDEN